LLPPQPTPITLTVGFIVDVAFCLVIVRYDLTLQRKRKPVLD